ncbi:histidine phosphatase family protein [Candidatus Colwellia aromaticivorans]|uniref:histidine phosphatase family protein n=1 Tax=Candidatus Colwellia aromaticivorans TaxID=2267621 RepID=UPI000DF2A518|nr:histidine phosphatase family protein [Candidatus Colwellia aromaticivorans]
MEKKQQEKSLFGEFTLYLLRHGEIATPGILAGKTDVALSEIGHKQLSQATDSLKHINRCISSPLVRCHEWASQYCQQQNLPLEVECKLQEMDFGDWDGNSYQALWKLADQSATSSIGDFWENPWQNQPPNGETMESFISRVDNWWKGYLTTNTSPNTLVVTHAGVIKYLLAKILNLPIPGTVHMVSLDVSYASLIRISLYRDENGKIWSKLVL